jgi:threonine/homoserine/homoserine lactone efflux protein
LILSAGEAVGDITYLTLAILSLGYLAQILEPAMIVVRWLGAGYLIYLGISQFRLASLNINSNTLSSKNLIRLFFMGFLIGGTNPKVILFYLSFIPLFIDLSNIDLTTGLQIASTVYVSVFASLVVVCIAGNQIKSWINKPRSIKILNRITGTMMIFVGLLLVVS